MYKTKTYLLGRALIPLPEASRDTIYRRIAEIDSESSQLFTIGKFEEAERLSSHALSLLDNPGADLANRRFHSLSSPPHQLVHASLMNNLAICHAELCDDRYAFCLTSQAANLLENLWRHHKDETRDGHLIMNYLTVTINHEVLKHVQERGDKRSIKELRRFIHQALISLPRHWPGTRSCKALIFNNLGCMLTDRGKGRAGLRYLRTSLAHFRRLSAITPGLVPRGWPVALNNLVNCNNTNGRLHELLNVAQQALKRYAVAADVWDEDRILNYVTYARLLLRCTPPQLGAAHEVLQQAAFLLEGLRPRFGNLHVRDRFVGQFQGVLELIPLVARRYGSGMEADRLATIAAEVVNGMEAAKSRRLLDMIRLANKDVSGPRAPDDVVRYWRESHDRLRRAQDRKALASLDIDMWRSAVGGLDHDRPRDRRPRVWTASTSSGITRQLDLQLTNGDTSKRVAEFDHSVRDAEADYARIMETVRKHDPSFNALLPGSALDHDRLKGLLESEIWAVGWLSTRDAMIATILVKDQPVFMYEYDQLSRSRLNRLIQSGFPRNSRKKSDDAQGFHETWCGGLEARLEVWGKKILSPLFDAAAKAGLAVDRLPPQLLLVPDGHLHRIPLHALPLPSSFGGGVLGDRFSVSYAPSLSLACDLFARKGDNHGRCMVVGSAELLYFSRLEIAAFRERYEGSLRVPIDAVVPDVIQKVSDSRICHISCHMEANNDDPFESRIHFANSDREDGSLKLRDIYLGLRMRNTEVTILNGCLSGVISDHGGKNPEGLTSGFLFAGSASVVSALWMVEDMSGALLMDRFHYELCRGSTVAESLKIAANWLRGKPGGLTNGKQACEAIKDLIERAKKSDESSGRQIGRKVFDYALEQAERLEKNDPDSAPFQHPSHWAAHVVHGAGWRRVFDQ